MYVVENEKHKDNEDEGNKKGSIIIHGIATDMKSQNKRKKKNLEKLEKR